MISNLPTLLGQQDFNAEHSHMLAAARDGRRADPKAAAREVKLVSGQGQMVIATDGPVIVRPPSGETFGRNILQCPETRLICAPHAFPLHKALK